MTIRPMKQEDREQAAKLWRLIFEDSEAFTEWFFRERYVPKHSYAAFDRDRMIAMTLGRPTRIVAEGKTHDALLISGVSTLPEYRGRGLMHELVGRQTEQAKTDGFACCYLHPVIKSLYASLGFRNGTEALLIRSDAQRTHQTFTIREGADATAMLAVYNALIPSHDGMQLRDETECFLILQDYGCDGVHTLIAYADDRPVGYICMLSDHMVAELFALCPSAYEALLDEASKRMGVELKAIVPTDCGIEGERVYSMQYLIFNDAFRLPLKNGFCRLYY